MVDSPSGDLTGAAVGRGPHDPVAGRRTRRIRLRDRGLRRHARRARSCCSSAATCDDSTSSSTRRPRARARSSTSTRAAPARHRLRRWFDMFDRRRRDRPDRWRRRSRPSQDLAGGVRQGLVGKTVPRCASSGAPGMTPTQNVIAETRGGDPNKVDRGRRPPRQRRHRSGHQRQRLRLGRDPRDRPAAARRVPEEQDPLHLVQRRGVRAARLAGLRREPAAEPSGQDRGDAELRHDRVAELRELRLRRRPVGLAADPEDVFAPRRGRSRRRSRRSSWTTSRASGSPTEPTDFDGRSDYGPFIAAGIPAGGLFTGAEGIKTPSRPRLRRHRREQFDRCYHLGCDDFFNNSNRALDSNSDAAAHALITLAQMKIPDWRRPRRPRPHAPARRPRGAGHVCRSCPTLDAAVDL